MFAQLRRATTSFRTRSTGRDEANDQATVGEVGRAIDRALAALLAEREGLSRRFDDAQMQASITAGTEHDEYLERDAEQSRRLSVFETEMKNASRRLARLDEHVAALRFLHACYVTRFPDL